MLLDRRLTSLPLATLAFAATLGCGASAATKREASGLRGHVSLGGICAAQRPGERCQRPYRTKVVVFSARTGKRMTTFRSAVDGAFRISLTPGRYVLRAAKAGLPRLMPRTVTVHRGRFTVVSLVFDAGIR